MINYTSSYNKDTDVYHTEYRSEHTNIYEHIVALRVFIDKILENEKSLTRNGVLSLLRENEKIVEELNKEGIKDGKRNRKSKTKI